MKVKISDTKLAKTTETKVVSELVWSVRPNADLVAQAVYVYRNNLRQGTAASKTRSEVSGGGKKPWAQKGTGRARSGSSRSPIWVGGGNVFTPTKRNWDRNLNKKMKLSALASVLTTRLKADEVHFLDMSTLSRADLQDVPRVTIITESQDVLKKIRNLSGVRIHSAATLNALDALAGRTLLFDLDSLDKLEARYSDGK